MIEEDRRTFKLNFKDQRRIINKEITLLDLVVEKEEEIERLGNELQVQIEDNTRLNEYIEEKDKEIERLNNIINELEKCIKDKYYEAVDYQTKIRQSDLMQGDYPVSYYLSEQNEQLCNYFLNRLKDLQELKGSEKE